MMEKGAHWAMISRQQYVSIADSLCPGLCAFYVLCDGQAALESRTLGGTRSAAAELPVVLDALSTVDADALDGGVSLGVGDHRSLYAINLQTYTEEDIGTLVLLSDSDDIPDEQGVNALSELLVNEYQLQQELDSVTVELTDRYEELNLIYGTDDYVDQFDKARPVLSSLVHDCFDRMHVDVAALILPNQGICFIESAQGSQAEAEALEGMLGKELLNWAAVESETIVINDMSSQTLAEHCPDLRKKLLLCPIYGYARSVCGYIAVLNSLRHSDFSNSDRNLLKIIARKATRIVQSNYDELTGSLNRGSFEYLMDELICQSQPGDKSSLLLVDLRGMHLINDSAGNKAGDALIQSCAKLLESQIGDGHFMARIEGDVFGISYTGVDIPEALQVAQQTLKAINTMAFNWNGVHYHTNACMGLVPIDLTQSAQAVISMGHIALRLACDKGSNIIEVQQSDNDDVALRKQRMKMLQNIQTALDADGFELFCQGVYPAHETHAPHHYEVLLRMVGADGNIISPDNFIPAAEYYKIMPEIDRWVIHNCLKTLSRNWHVLEKRSESWAINLSGQTFSQPDLIEFISSELRLSGIPPERIAFEVTETVAVEDLSNTRLTIESVQALGCEFYLDDFGTGLSSFSYLLELPFDHVKIDGRFIKNVVNDNVSQTMVKAIGDVAYVLGMKTVAEYVEDDETITALQRIGIEYLQGYGLHKPTNIKEVIRTMAVLNQARA